MSISHGFAKDYAKLTKKKEKLVNILTDDTALSQAERTAKEQQVKDLQADLLTLQQYLPDQRVKKVIHQ